MKKGKNTSNQQSQIRPTKKPQKRNGRSLLALRKRKQRIVAAVVVSVVAIVVLPVLIAIVLWWRGLLPTREELPRYKARLILMLQGWQHTRLPEGDVIGIDISHYQSVVDYENLQFHLDETRRMYSSEKKNTKPRSVDFVVVKATEGSRMRDSYYNRNKQGCREHNILFGAYHFYSLQAPATEQAENYIQYSKLQKGDIIPIVDIEPVDGRLPERDSVKKWLQIVERYYGVTPMIYTNENTYKQHFHDNNNFRQYPFWIARYGGKEPSRLHAIWQCAENGRVGGISGPVDVNIFKGSEADLLLYKIQ